MTDRALLQQVLEALDGWNHVLDPKPDANLITALRERLAQPEQEPVARVNDDGFIVETGLLISPGQLLYTAPLQRKPLTEEEIETLWQNTSPYYDHQDFARAIEAKLREKNT